MATEIGEREMEYLAIGAAVLGAGGGGDPYLGRLMAAKAIREYGPITMLDPSEVPDDALVIPTAMMGAPTVMVEKVPNGDEALKSLRGLEQFLGQTAFATMPIESGGINSTLPFNVAARARIPIVDADGMGRAFPELHMETFHVYGVEGTPMYLYNERGDWTLLRTLDNEMLEHISRGICVRMGGVAHIAEYAMTGRQVKQTAIPNTISLGMAIGQALIEARHTKQDPVAALQAATAGSSYGQALVLFAGKVVDVERRTTGGFVRGHALVQGFDQWAGQTLQVDFQNENLIARTAEQVLATVPDIFTFLDAETGAPITTEGLRYGFRVQCVGIPVPPIMRTPAALGVWGPRAFGYDLDYVPLEQLHRR